MSTKPPGLWFEPLGLRPKCGLIMMHGLGAGCDNLHPVLCGILAQAARLRGIDAGNPADAQQLLDRHRLPIACVLPQAPLRAVTIAGGASMPAWFDIHSLDRNGREDEEGLHQARELVNAAVAQLNRRGLADHNIVIGGFSQGGIVALHCLCREPGRFAGVFALSGCLARNEAVAEGGKTPVFISHGALDDVIPPQYGREARHRLEEAGFAVEWREYPALGHTIDDLTVRDLVRWGAPVSGCR